MVSNARMVHLTLSSKNDERMRQQIFRDKRNQRHRHRQIAAQTFRLRLGGVIDGLVAFEAVCCRLRQVQRQISIRIKVAIMLRIITRRCVLLLIVVVIILARRVVLINACHGHIKQFSVKFTQFDFVRRFSLRYSEKSQHCHPNHIVILKRRCQTFL